MEFGEKIAALRKSHGMTQAELGSELNVTFQAVSKWERGESLPDFATMSKIAKLFGVPLTYFEDGEELNADGGDAGAVEPEEKEEQSAKMLGVCTKCGRVVYEGNEAPVTGSLVCSDCYSRQRAEIIKKKEAEKEEAQRKQRQDEINRRLARAAIKSKRNRGFIVGGMVAGLVAVISAVSIGVAGGDNVGDAVLGAIVLTVLAFTFVSQLVWGGAVRTVCLTGGAIIGTPGVIFTLDLDGMIFLIGVKILFAVLKLFVFLITSLALVFIAIVISPFTFIPKTVKVCKGDFGD